MFEWTDDTIRFMQDASASSSYFRELAGFIYENAGPAESVCDAGCGLGQLSFELRKFYDNVVGIDIDDKVMNCLKAEPGVTFEKADMTIYSSKTKFSLLIFNYFADIEEILEIRKKCCAGKTVIIKGIDRTHRFSFKTDKRNNSFKDAEEYLRSAGIPFIATEFSCEFGQPFRNIDDAVLFFSINSGKPVDTETVRAKLVLKNNDEFPFYYPYRKQSGVIIL